MKTIILLALIFGYMAPAYSQINRHRKMEPSPGQRQNRLNGDLDKDKYKFDENFSVPWFDVLGSRFKNSPLPGENEFMKKNSGYYMPCFHPKSGDPMPCAKPTGEFHMRVFKPENVIWGILW